MIIPPRYIVVALLCMGSFALGWHLHPPAPPSYQPTIAIRERAAAAETVFVRDTVHFAKWRTHYDTVRATLNIHDTVEVVKFVQVADTTIFSCRKALLSCTTALQKKDTVVHTQARVIEQHQKPRSFVRDLVVGASMVTLAGIFLKNR